MKKEPKTKLNTKGKHPGGRPSEYNDEVVSKTNEYIDSCEDKVNLPTIEGLALYLGVRRETLYDWENKYKEFSNIIDKLRQKQADTLISKGL